jgi:hypothetical protein
VVFTKSFLHYLPDVNCRAAIYAPPELGLVFHPNLPSRDCATTSVSIEGERVYFSSVYLDIHFAVEEPAWLLTMQKASSTRRHFLAGIDTNSHSNVWGSPSPNARGMRVEEVLFNHGLCVLNEGNDPTFQTSQAATCIDITVASPALASLVTKWKVNTKKHMLDHYLITADHNCPGPEGFRPIVLCNLPTPARTALLKIYSAIIELQYTPQRWRNAEVIFLPKPGKDGYTNSRAFRPISLMLFLFKTLERLVK